MFSFILKFIILTLIEPSPYEQKWIILTSILQGGNIFLFLNILIILRLHTRTIASLLPGIYQQLFQRYTGKYPVLSLGIELKYIACFKVRRFDEVQNKMGGASDQQI